MKILTNVFDFLTDPKNARVLLLVGIGLLVLLFLHQCNRTNHFKNQVEIEKNEAKRLVNNLEASRDTIKQWKFDKNTWRAEKYGYEITLDELKAKYIELLGDFELEKNKPPKVLIKTEYVIVDRIVNVPVYIELDEFGNTQLAFSDSARYDPVNFRFINGKIPYKVVFDPIDSVYNVVPGLGELDLSIGMNLNLGLFQDKDTKKVTIKADTDFPGVSFTRLDGALVMDDPESKKILKSMRKPWSIGFSVGYGAGVGAGANKGTFHGPYVGVGLVYSPKFFQWGK